VHLAKGPLSNRIALNGGLAEEIKRDTGVILKEIL
jgi:hypothetical protein